MNNTEFQAHAGKVEQSLQRVNELDNDNARASALELMQSLMDLHGATVSRIVELLSEAGEAGRKALATIADDPLVCGLLVLYGVHPVPLEERVTRAVESLGPQLQKLGTTLEVMSTAENVVRIRVHNSRPDPHSETTVQAAIERAIREAAPEVVEIAIEGMMPAGFVPLNMVQPAMKLERGEAI
jgi:Fe-S cluster biogenesis protein NfuA